VLHYDERHEQISLAMNYFWDLLEAAPAYRRIDRPKGPAATWEAGMRRMVITSRRSSGAGYE